MAILDTISDIGKTVAQKSSDFAESGKLALNIKKKEHEIKSLEYQLGQYIFDKYLSGSEFDDTVKDICNQIEHIFIDIENLRSERESIGVNHLDVEVVDTVVPDVDSDFAITEEEEELLRDL